MEADIPTGDKKARRNEVRHALSATTMPSFAVLTPDDFPYATGLAATMFTGFARCGTCATRCSVNLLFAVNTPSTMDLLPGAMGGFFQNPKACHGPKTGGDVKRWVDSVNPKSWDAVFFYANVYKDMPKEMIPEGIANACKDKAHRFTVMKKEYMQAIENSPSRTAIDVPSELHKIELAKAFLLKLEPGMENSTDKRYTNKKRARVEHASDACVLKLTLEDVQQLMQKKARGTEAPDGPVVTASPLLQRILGASNDTGKTLAPLSQPLVNAATVVLSTDKTLAPLRQSLLGFIMN